MKMRDVFGTSLLDDPGKRLCSSMVLIGPEKDAAIKAISMHDKLVSLVEKMALQADCIDDIVDEFVGQRSLPEVAKEQQKMLELMSEAETLLNQAKGE